MIGYTSIIKRISEKNIWHEVCHVLGAQDHYETQHPCDDENCIMQYGVENGSLCS